MTGPPPPAAARSRRALQATLGVLALIPLGTGALELLGGPATLPGTAPAGPDLESQYRFLGAVWFGLGCLLVAAIPRVERQGRLLRALAGIVLLGGAGRLLAIAVSGLPHPVFLAATAVELVAPPLLVWWQQRVRRQMGGGGPPAADRARSAGAVDAAQDDGDGAGGVHRVVR